MTGRVALVTGGNTGIGLQAAKALAEGGNEVILACRDRDHGLAAVDIIKREFPSSLVTFMQLDLASASSVRAFVQEFMKKKRHLNVLINNAAIRLSPKDLTRKTTVDGNELTMGTNYLGPFLLTNLLLEFMMQTAMIMGDGRIINIVCSDHDSQHSLASRGLADLDINNFQLENSESYSGPQAYKNSKLCLLLMTYKLAKHLKGTALTVNALDPGLVPKSSLHRHRPKYQQFLCVCCLHHVLGCFKVSETVENAGLHLYRMSTSEKYSGISGKYFDRGHEQRSSVESYDGDLQEKVWTATCRLLDYHSNIGDTDFDDISLGEAKDPLLKR